ncbi:cytochrome P450 1A1-like [Asterias rubens]|uniref:cytochrome P450 1A1-like n=1 Tax=Asterias rubens TaxID=7604 RepID=UPI0014553387|nr:cytochrome P450 1A1-like [Asterias rubens]
MAVAELISENTVTVLLFMVTLVVLLLVQNARRPSGFPPGPPALPIIGNVLEFRSRERIHQTFLRLSQKYGRLFSLKLGSFWVIVLNDAEDIRQAVVKQPVEFAGRPLLHSTSIFTEGYKDIAFSDYNPEWSIHRKLGHSALRHFAQGVKVDKLTQGILPSVAEVLDGSLGKPFDIKPVIDRSIFIILARMCYGKSYKFDDQQLTKWFDLNKEIQVVLGGGLPRDFIHSLKYLPRLPKEKAFRKLTEESLRFTYDEFDGHRESFDPDNIRDLFDSLIAAQKEAIAEGGSTKLTAEFLTDARITQTVADMFGAGTGTTIPTLLWAIAIMIEHPHILQRVSKEIDEVIGQDRLPCISDRGSMPYTEAFLLEVNRFGSVGPVGLPKSVTKDTTLFGYKLPKDTMVMLNMWAAHYDPKYWDEPTKFNPERFLDESGAVLTRLPAAYMPFGLGPRACIGENFAKGEIFILICWLFGHYSFSKVPGKEDESLFVLDEVLGFSHELAPYEIIVNKREI